MDSEICSGADRNRIHSIQRGAKSRREYDEIPAKICRSTELKGGGGEIRRGAGVHSEVSPAMLTAAVWTGRIDRAWTEGRQ